MVCWKMDKRKTRHLLHMILTCSLLLNRNCVLCCFAVIARQQTEIGRSSIKRRRRICRQRRLGCLLLLQPTRLVQINYNILVSARAQSALTHTDKSRSKCTQFKHTLPILQNKTERSMNSPTTGLQWVFNFLRHSSMRAHRRPHCMPSSRFTISPHTHRQPIYEYRVWCCKYNIWQRRRRRRRPRRLSKTTSQQMCVSVAVCVCSCLCLAAKIQCDAFYKKFVAWQRCAVCARAMMAAMTMTM